MNGAVWYRVRAQLRSSAAGLAVVAILLGLASGVVLAAAAGARRTGSAYPRMLATYNAPDILISPNGDGSGEGGLYEDVVAIDGVRETGLLRGTSIVFTDGPNAGSMVAGPTMAPFDDHFAQTVGAPKILDGRMWNPDVRDEIVVNRFFADAYDVEVGDRIPFEIPTWDDESEPVTVDYRIVGIGTTAQEVVPFTDLDAAPSAILSPGIARELKVGHYGFEGLAIDLTDPDDAAAVMAEIDSLATQYDEELPDGVFAVDLASNVEQVNHSIGPLAGALAIFAIAMGVVVVVVIGQSIRRHVLASPQEIESLDAIGFRRRERRVVLLVRGGLLGSIGAVIALAAAFAISPLFPIGPARVAEPNEGLAFDAVVLVPGALAVLVFAMVATLSNREARSTDTEAVSPVGRLRTSPAIAAGLRAAWPATNRGGASVLIAAVGGVVAVFAAATFSASLADLVDHPARYGQSWDRLVDGQFGPAPLGEVFDRFGDDDRVESIAVGDYGQALIGSERIPSISWEPVKGQLDLVAIEGRAASAEGEIALGGQTLEDLGVAIGDTIEADVGLGPTEFEVVGQLVFPRFGLGSFGTTGLGVGAQFATDAMPPQSAPPPDELGEAAAMFEHDGLVHSFAALVFADRPGAEAWVDGHLGEIGERVAAAVGEPSLTRVSQRPTTISDLDRVRSVPALLSVVLGGVGAATLAHTLASSVRSRRRELAVMSAVGFDRKQLAASVLWHALAIAAVAVVLATPLGVAAGRVAWRFFAGEFHVPARPVVPLLTFAAVIATTLFIATVAAAPFARRATRTHPAIVLRSE